MTQVEPILAPVMQFVNPRRELLGVTQALVSLLRPGAEPSVAMICGLEGGEGATTIASNLARALADEFRNQVCLVRIAEAADTPSAAEASPGVDVVTATLNRADLGGAIVHGLRGSLPRLQAAPLIYLIDGPPLLGSLEAYRLCNEVDALILVVEADRTTGAKLDAARAVVAGSRCRLLGAVLNKRRHWLPAFLSTLFGGEFRPRPPLPPAVVDGAPDRLR